MIIDFHTHMFPDKIAGRTLDYLSGIFGASPFADGTYTGLCNSMGKGAVESCIRIIRICILTISAMNVLSMQHHPKCPEDVHCTPKMARKVLDDVKPEKLVLAHMGGNEMWDDVERYLVGQNVYFDTGVILNTMPQEQFLRIVHMHGADRILFGTDSPWADQKNFVALLEHMPLTEEEKAAIFSENAKKLLGI